jgi:AbrB family looped-hinge helix DNA binding protein
MNMQTNLSSKLTSKYQATIPAKVRDCIGLKAGDSIAFEITNDKKVILRKVTHLDHEFAKALEGTLSEWLSEYDEEAYNDL